MAQAPPNPYAPRPAGHEFEPPIDSRTSVLAVIALVLALLCFIPGLGVLALLVGGVAVLLISGSHGRLRGMGIAATACVLGLITSVLWVLVTVGMVGAAQQANQVMKPMLMPAQTALTAMEKGDYAAARATFSPALSARVTDDDMKTFVEAYQAKVGSFQSGPQSLSQYMSSWWTLGTQLGQNNQGNTRVSSSTNDAFPIPARFSSGWAVIMFPMTPGAQPPPPPAGSAQTFSNFPVENLGVLVPNNPEIWLVPPAELGSPTPSGVDAMEDFSKPDSDKPEDADTPSDAPSEPAPAEPAPASGTP